MGADAALYSKGEVSPWRAPLSGLCASLIGIGLSRFAARRIGMEARL